MTDDPRITIEDDGRILSRIYAAEKLADIAGVPDVEALSSRGEKIWLVYDRNAADAADAVAKAQPVASTFAVDATEAGKSISTVVEICRWLMENGADRRSLLLAVGGGITTDMAGFAASVYKRGIRFAYVPTTLLSQVDASVGGKTGVNLDSYKNMIGTITQPEFVWLCSEPLISLSYRNFLSGAAEMLKTFIISGGRWYGQAAEFLRRLRDHVYGTSEVAGAAGFGSGSDAAFREFLSSEHERRALSDLIVAAVSVKAEIVSEDRFETGRRRVLNLGHTFAHAIEWKGLDAAASVSAGSSHPADRPDPGSSVLTHGEAVAVGIVLAAELSEAAGLAAEGFASGLAADFASCGLPVSCPYPVSELTAAMSRDKKSEGGAVRFILMRGIGEAEERLMTPQEAGTLLQTRSDALGQGVDGRRSD